jgi:outer membrane protein assembly factor BamB
MRTTAAVLTLLLGASWAGAQDWPQWRGPNRDNHVTGFTAPKSWPKTLTQKWKVTVGQGDSSPVLVGDKIFVFGRTGGDEVVQCLDAATGNEIWKKGFASQAPGKPDGGLHAGPRSTPAVADGKVCAFGVNGLLVCLDAAKGDVLWKHETGGVPQYHTSSSPLIADGKCIVYASNLTAYDLASGESKWKWSGAPAPYGSPVLMTVDGTKQIVTPAGSSVVGISLEGKEIWKIAYGGGGKGKGMGGDSMITPIVDGSSIICAGPGGTILFKVEKQGDGFKVSEVWKKKEGAHKYNTPVLKDGLLFGMTGGAQFYCMDAKSGDVLWTDSKKRGECGEILDAGSVLVALTSDSQLEVFEPSNKGFMEVAHYDVAKTATWAAPIVAGNRIFVKDQNSLTLWTIE